MGVFPEPASLRQHDLRQVVRVGNVSPLSPSGSPSLCGPALCGSGGVVKVVVRQCPCSMWMRATGRFGQAPPKFPLGPRRVQPSSRCTAVCALNGRRRLNKRCLDRSNSRRALSETARSTASRSRFRRCVVKTRNSSAALRSPISVRDICRQWCLAAGWTGQSENSARYDYLAYSYLLVTRSESWAWANPAWRDLENRSSASWLHMSQP